MVYSIVSNSLLILGLFLIIYGFTSAEAQRTTEHFNDAYFVTGLVGVLCVHFSPMVSIYGVLKGASQ